MFLVKANGQALVPVEKTMNKKVKKTREVPAKSSPMLNPFFLAKESLVYVA